MTRGQAESEGFTIRGSQFGAEVQPRTVETDGTDSPLVVLLVEDDGHWGESQALDAMWLDDLIAVLRAAMERLQP